MVLFHRLVCVSLCLIAGTLTAGAGAARAEDPILERALSRYESRMKSAEESLERARGIYESARERATEDLLEAYESAIRRATSDGDLETANALLAAKKALQQVGEPAAPLAVGASTDDPALVKVPTYKRDSTFFRCVLGGYIEHVARKPVPFANLSIPNKNLWNEEVQRVLRGKVDMASMHYAGRARVVIPENGTYFFDVVGGKLELNGREVKAGEVDLAEGTYVVQFESSNYGQPSLGTAAVGIYSDKEKTAEIPLICSAAEIEAFLASKIGGQPLTEVSGWKPTKGNLVEQ